ncbi:MULTISPECIES: YbaY family lipoprotein [unclassified Beijerinckia]|uniref:YbaY family lipoprotein n=1 Tax=unclassified Beijerinckia TaxID=2638183 RepID=UPI00089642C6|nr:MULTISPECIES: YbaY family lipoprotein [unclassified Beijerinckia]MDH7796232.1 putative lipoprotein [Beijerinckia sp. GAS462]SEC36150.1 putative lipoprotein [Beijerinckia sp. 28-YEA-48]
MMIATKTGAWKAGIWRRTTLAIAVAVLAAAFHTAPAAAKSRSLSGTVTYRERMALPPSSLVEVQLVDISLADAPARVLARTTLWPRRQVPLRYRLRYDDTQIIANHTYALQARITLGGRLLFINTTRHSLSADGLAGGREGFGDTDILVERVADSPRTQEPAAPARPDGRWLAEDIGGGGVIDRLQTVLEIAPNGAVSGSGGCNRMVGKANIAGDRLSFGPIASTKMACPPAAMNQEAKFFAALADVRAWRVDAIRQKLILLDAQGRTIITLARM